MPSWPIGVIHARTNPNVIWAKQVRPTIDAGPIYSASLVHRADPICRGTCFATTISTIR